MTGHHQDVHDVDDHAFAAAWRAFAEDDVRTTAPPALEARVREAAFARFEGRQRAAAPPPRYRLWAGLGAAAALLMLTIGGLVWSRFSNAPATNVVESRVAPAEEDQSPPSGAPADGSRSTRPARSAAAPSAAVARAQTEEPVLAVLAIDPLRDTEELALVRLRVPPAALAAYGIAITEPVTTGLVDIDVLIGSDGLPRDIRRVRAVLSDEDGR